MHSNVTIKNVSWPHFSWPTLYIFVPASSVVVVVVVVCSYERVATPGSVVVTQVRCRANA